MTAKVAKEDAPEALQEGVQVQLSNGLTATVAEVTAEHVVIDANHTLAGKDLTFDVELVQLQKVCYRLKLTAGEASVAQSPGHHTQTCVQDAWLDACVQMS